MASSSLQHSSAFHRLAIPQRCNLQKACFGKTLLRCLRMHVNTGWTIRFDKIIKHIVSLKIWGFNKYITSSTCINVLGILRVIFKINRSGETCGTAQFRGATPQKGGELISLSSFTLLFKNLPFYAVGVILGTTLITDRIKDRFWKEEIHLNWTKKLYLWWD